MPVFASFESKLVVALKWFNHILHALLAVALVMASLMVIWEFSASVLAAIHQGNIAHGFLQALGSLFIVWTLSSLISAEINFVQNGVFHLLVFIEVAIITLLRQLIVEPVQVATTASEKMTDFSALHYGLVLAALLVVGILHKLIASSNPPRSGPGESANTD